MNREQYNRIYIDALDLAIYFLKLKEKQTNRGLIPEVSEQQIMDKKFKAGMYKGLSIAIQEIQNFKQRILKR